MRADLASLLTDWLLTYWLHATVMLGAVALISRRTASFSARDVMWKVALIGPVLTATLSMNWSPRRVELGAQSGVHPDALSQPLFQAIATGDVAQPVTDGDGGVPTAGPAVTPGLFGAWSSLDFRQRFLVTWGLVAGVLVAGLLLRRLRLMHSIGHRELVTDSRLRHTLESLCLIANYPHAVKLTSSRSLASPVALPGPEICLPEAVVTDLGPEQQRGVLAHELAHLHRLDPFWLGLAQVMERVFFLQPLNWLARRELQVTAEYLCDDWAARQVGSGLPLARCLLTVAEWIAGAPGPVPEPAMAARGSHLLRRVERLVRGDALRGDGGGRIGFVTGALLLAATIFGVPAVVASEPARQDSASGKSGSEKEGIPRPVSDTIRSARVAALVAALKDSDAGVRAAAAHALGNLDDRRAANALADAMRDTDPQVQRAATFALAELEDQRAASGLERMLADPDGDVRQEAADKLGDLELQQAPAALLAAFKDTDADVRHSAAHAAGHIGDPRAVPGLKALLTDPDKDVRAAAVESLKEIGDPTALQVLIDALKSNDPSVRKVAAEALGQDH